MTTPAIESAAVSYTVARLLSGKCQARRRRFDDGFIRFFQERAADGLVISYYDLDSGYGPMLSAGHYGELPTMAERAEIERVVGLVTGVSAVCSGERVGRPGGYLVMDWFWRAV